MKEVLLKVAAFPVIWVIFFISCVCFLNPFETFLKVIKLKFRELNPVELWISLMDS